MLGLCVVISSLANIFRDILQDTFAEPLVAKVIAYSKKVLLKYKPLPCRAIRCLGCSHEVRISQVVAHFDRYLHKPIYRYAGIEWTAFKPDPPFHRATDA